MVVIRGGSIRGSTSIRGQVRGSIYEGLDLAAAATVVDIGRHRPKLISATRPLCHSATLPCRHVAFLDKPDIVILLSKTSSILL